jgi:hypothetical protein
VVPSPNADSPDAHPQQTCSLELTANEQALDACESASPPRRKNYPWSELLKRVFSIDVLSCEHCGGRVRVLAVIHSPETTRKILDHLGLPSRPPPIASASRQDAHADY